MEENSPDNIHVVQSWGPLAILLSHARVHHDFKGQEMSVRAEQKIQVSAH